MPRQNKKARANKQNGLKTQFRSCQDENTSGLDENTLLLLADVKVSTDMLISRNATALLKIRPLVNPDKMRTCICWFEDDPMAMFDPAIEIGERYVERKNSSGGQYFWEDLTADDDEDEVDLEITEDEADAKITKLHELEKRWRLTGHNSNVRGAGTSRSTFFAHQAQDRLLASDALAHSQPINRFFTKKTEAVPHTRMDVVSEEEVSSSDEEVEQPPADHEGYESDDDEFDDLFVGNQHPVPETSTSSLVKLTIKEGIDKLNSPIANPSRSVAKEKKIDLMAWQRMSPTFDQHHTSMHWESLWISPCRMLPVSKRESRPFCRSAVSLRTIMDMTSGCYVTRARLTRAQSWKSIVSNVRGLVRSAVRRGC